MTFFLIVRMYVSTVAAKWFVHQLHKFTSLSQSSQPSAKGKDGFLFNINSDKKQGEL
jgi:hypothetical protein